MYTFLIAEKLKGGECRERREGEEGRRGGQRKRRRSSIEEERKRLHGSNAVQSLLLTSLPLPPPPQTVPRGDCGNWVESGIPLLCGTQEILVAAMESHPVAARLVVRRQERGEKVRR